jgi:hypothetical protein
MQVDWSAVDQVPMQPANVIMVQQGQHEFIITFGAVAPPISATPITLEQAKSMKLKAQVVGRIVLAPGRVVELIEVLRQQLTFYQQTQKH